MLNWEFRDFDIDFDLGVFDSTPIHYPEVDNYAAEFNPSL